MQTRNCGYIKDWKPGPYPVTKEEREAAAKKYFMIPEDYEPHPEGSGYGDYPMLPPIGQDTRDPYEDYDVHYRRRNYGETFHSQYECMSADRHNPNQMVNPGYFTMLYRFVLFMVIMYGLSWFAQFYDVRVYYPVKPKQYARDGKHYTFEPLD